MYISIFYIISQLDVLKITLYRVSLYKMRILGIETSCDETAVAIVDDGIDMKSNVIASSMELHAVYGGVVPEIAARSHIESIIPVIQQSLNQANSTWDQIDAIAVTYGAGLGGSLLVGVMTARSLAIIKNKPLVACNHVLGHIYANFISSSSLAHYSLPATKPQFPLLAIIVSGGHTQLALFESHLKYRLLGKTQDDAIGEAFDKVAKMLGLPYPGGPSISEIALKGDPLTFSLPKAKVGKYDFSFSGLKTAVLRLSQEQIGESYDFPSYMLSERLNNAQKANIAASFQYTAINTIVDKVKLAVHEFKPHCVLLAGGVAANKSLRDTLEDTLACPLVAPDIKLCTDNGAMIAALGGWQIKHDIGLADPYRLEISPNLSM
jgi:N6-L-threonylcarbamoyladenine synthase